MRCLFILFMTTALLIVTGCNSEHESNGINLSQQSDQTRATQDAEMLMSLIKEKDAEKLLNLLRESSFYSHLTIDNAQKIIEGFDVNFDLDSLYLKASPDGKSAGSGWGQFEFSLLDRKGDNVEVTDNSINELVVRYEESGSAAVFHNPLISYFPFAEGLVKTYIQLISEEKVSDLAGFMNPDDVEIPDRIAEETILNYQKYFEKESLSFRNVEGFTYAIENGKGKSHLIEVIYGDGLMNIADDFRPEISQTTIDSRNKVIDALPFLIEGEVDSIALTVEGTDREYTVPETRHHVILQTLSQTDMAQAAAINESPSGPNATIRINGKEQLYEVPFNIESNMFEVKGQWIYADDQTLLLLHSLIKPDSQLAQIDRLMEKARNEYDKSPGIDDTIIENGDGFLVNNKDYLAWGKELQHCQTIQKWSFYDSAEDKVKAVSICKGGVAVLNRNIVFMADKYETPDGIRVGSSRNQVLKKLGEPNVKLETQWSYKIGDYLKFHLYFEQDKVRFIVLRMPL